MVGYLMMTVTNLLMSLLVKLWQNQSASGEVTGKR